MLALNSAQKFHGKLYFLLEDKCPEVVDVTKEMPQIVNHLMKKACTSMVFTPSGLGLEVRGECSKTAWQSRCSVSMNSSNKFECSLIARHLNFACASNTGSLATYGQHLSLGF